MMPGTSRIAPALTALALCLHFGGTLPAMARDEPGVFDYYVLVLGWSPSYCIIEGDKRRDSQCRANTSHDFVLHGLWPQYEEGWPKDCYAGKRPWVPSQVIDEMRDIMPSKGLIIHEYSTHGTCAGLSPEQYYGVARKLYDRVTVPPRFVDPEAQHVLSPVEVEREFLAANAWLEPDMIAVTCRKSNLLDIRVCFSRDLSPRACGENESQKRLCQTPRIAVPAP
ncbi:MAG: ribonuclease T2 family protein [Methyloceanibacter sp.]